MVRKLRLVDKIWRVAFPISLYGIITMVLPILLTIVLDGRFLEPGAEMWLLTVENLLILPGFWLLYRGDQAAYKRDSKYEGQALWGIKELVLVIVGAVSISRGVNYFLALTFLPQLFPGYRLVSEGISQCSLLSQMVAVVVSAPLLEEVLMRGLVYGRLREVLNNPRSAMVVSALIFGIFHGNVVQGMYAFVVGLFFAQVYEVFGTLSLSVLAHVVVNAVSMLEAHYGWMAVLWRIPGAYYLLTAGFLLTGMACFRYFGQRM